MASFSAGLQLGLYTQEQKGNKADWLWQAMIHKLETNCVIQNPSNKPELVEWHYLDKTTNYNVINSQVICGLSQHLPECSTV